MEISEKQNDTYATLSPIGELDANSSILMDEVIEKYIEKGVYKLHIECSGLEYISSAGLGVFISFYEKLRENGGDFVFSGMSDETFKVFELLGLNQFMKIVKEETEVTNHFAA